MAIFPRRLRRLFIVPTNPKKFGLWRIGGGAAEHTPKPGGAGPVVPLPPPPPPPATVWNSAAAEPSLILGPGNSVQGVGAAAAVYATVGFPANDPGDHTFKITKTADDWGSLAFGIAKAGLPLNDRLYNYDPAAPKGMELDTGPGRIFDIGWSTLASLTGGTAILVGDTVEFRMKAGKLYVRLIREGVTGNWNGDQWTAQYAMADPDAGNGIPLDAFGSTVMYPWVYTETDTITADFTGWSS